DAVAHIDGPFDRIALVAGMPFHLDVHARVKHLQSQRDLFLLGQRQHALDPFHKILLADFVPFRPEWQIAPHARKCDYSWTAKICRSINSLGNALNAEIPILLVIPTFHEAMAAGDGAG